MEKIRETTNQLNVNSLKNFIDNIIVDSFDNNCWDGQLNQFLLTDAFKIFIDINVSKVKTRCSMLQPGNKKLLII